MTVVNAMNPQHVNSPFLGATGSWVLDDAEYRLWVNLLENRTGVVIPPERKQFLESNLRLRMRELGLSELKTYHDHHLFGRNGAKEWATLVDRLTVHQTHFFRHQPSLDLVKDVVLPDFCERQPDKGAFHAWSVGCSTGEEANSLAMVIDQFSEAHERPFHFGITASDVSQPALMVGKAGIYSKLKQAEIPKGYQQLYCKPHDENEFMIDPKLMGRIGFAVLNLLEVHRQPMSRLDLVFCQNVLIYFPRSRREQVLAQLAACLRPGGVLVLGPGEITHWTQPKLERISMPRTLAYRCKAED